MWDDHGAYLKNQGLPSVVQVEGVTPGALDALAANELLHIRISDDAFGTRDCTLTGKAYAAVDTNFAASRHVFYSASDTAGGCHCLGY